MSEIVSKFKRGTHNEYSLSQEVEVEEISYEEYLELSQKGDTFEEPLYDDFGISPIKLIY